MSVTVGGSDVEGVSLQLAIPTVSSLHTALPECCSVLQCVAVCCSVLQRGAASPLHAALPEP